LLLILFKNDREEINPHEIGKFIGLGETGKEKGKREYLKKSFNFLH